MSYLRLSVCLSVWRCYSGHGRTGRYVAYGYTTIHCRAVQIDHGRSQTMATQALRGPWPGPMER